MAKDINWDDVVDRLVKSKNFKENIKKVLVENSSALNKLDNYAEKFAAAKRWAENLPYCPTTVSLDSCAEYVIDHRQEDVYYTNRDIILNFKESDHFNLVRNLMEHYICQVYNATHPVEYEESFYRYEINGLGGKPRKWKGKFTERQYAAFYHMAEELDKIRVQIIESKKAVRKNSVKKYIKLSQFEQDLLLDMIDYYLNLPEKNWYTVGSREGIEDVKYDLQYLHDLIENL